MQNSVVKNYVWVFLTILLTLLDIGSKYWIKNNFFIGESKSICSGINFYYIQNSGLAFGLFANIAHVIYFKLIFIWLSIFTLIILIIVFYKSIVCHCFYDSLSYSMIIGGGLGNLYNRIFCDAVIDFIDIYVSYWHWPVFNIADVEICSGIIILSIRYFLVSQDK
ncbi:lipoprotein signal peptidase [Candidatus Blochmanniella vafra str. BVAF]|uniref:Lipoprotein signal peptidase n=2 Tax=Candidatus Blochmanniella vafra TaxID=251535 RepID=E8Q5N0_BLOVB|nr:lipoprotein signal peptidase [Candidatus Blochmannia vafer str. BVAF]